MSKKKGMIVSGYFNPIHKGHIEYFNNAKALASALALLKYSICPLCIGLKYPDTIIPFFLLMLYTLFIFQNHLALV